MTGMLRGHVALVSGAGQGIGKGIALALAAHGAKVAIGVRSIEKGEGVLREIDAAGGHGAVVAMDVTNTEQVDNAIAETNAAFGGLSILVHNANNNMSGRPAAAEDIDDNTWLPQYDVTLGGLFRSAKAAYPLLRDSRRGRLIVLCSTFGYHGAALNPNYSALKSAERGFIKSLAHEWGPDKITVNAICPAALTESSIRFFNENPEVKIAYERKYALKRMGTPREDVGEAVAHMCSDGMGYMTGANLFLDGGLYPGAA